MTNKKAVAEKLLQVAAVKLSPENPYTWASGWKSPIYCDNRRVLSFPFVRDFIKSELCNVIFEQYPDAEVLAGVATAGIPWGAMAADQLKLPYIYVRPKPKEHGLGNQIEGFYSAGQKVLVIEDLISTGKSSLQVVDVLRNVGAEVVGMYRRDLDAIWRAARIVVADWALAAQIAEFPNAVLHAADDIVVAGRLARQQSVREKAHTDP